MNKSVTIYKKYLLNFGLSKKFYFFRLGAKKKKYKNFMDHNFICFNKNNSFALETSS